MEENPGLDIVDKVVRSIGFKAKLKIAFLMILSYLINLIFFGLFLAVAFSLFKYFFLVK